MREFASVTPMIIRIILSNDYPPRYYLMNGKKIVMALKNVSNAMMELVMDTLMNMELMPVMK